MQISKSIVVKRDEETISKVRQYWEESGFRLEPTDLTTFTGKRGTWLGTFGSLGYSKCRTKLKIRYDGGRLDCSMHVDTRFRGVVLWHRKLMELELTTFESVLLTGDRQQEAWAEYHRDSKHAIRDAVADTFGHLFRRRKPNRPMQIGGDLVFQTWTLVGVGVLASISFLLLGDGPMVWHDMADRTRSFGHALAPGRSMFMAALMGAIFAMLAAMTHKLWRNGRRCLNVERAAVKLGLDSEALQKAIELRGVKAKFIMDGEPVYDLEDITGAAILLRPVEGTEEAVLLKPVNDVNNYTDCLLLRPLKEPESENSYITSRS